MRPSAWPVALLLVGGCSISGGPEADGPRTVVFEGEDLCGELTDDRGCGYVMCDLIPEGQTFAETCGPYFQEGYAPVGALSNDELESMLNLVSECSSVGDVGDNRLTISPADTDRLTIAGPTEWLERWESRFTEACNI